MKKVRCTEADRACQECGTIFKKPSLMKGNMASHMDPFLYNNVMDRVMKSEDGSQVTCKECGKNFSSIKKHKGTHSECTKKWIYTN
jgi:predicted transcriptional regulator